MSATARGEDAVAWVLEHRSRELTWLTFSRHGQGVAMVKRGNGTAFGRFDDNQ